MFTHAHIEKQKKEKFDHTVEFHFGFHPSSLSLLTNPFPSLPPTAGFNDPPRGMLDFWRDSCQGYINTEARIFQFLTRRALPRAEDIAPTMLHRA